MYKMGLQNEGTSPPPHKPFKNYDVMNQCRSCSHHGCVIGYIVWTKILTRRTPYTHPRVSVGSWGTFTRTPGWFIWFLGDCFLLIIFLNIIKKNNHPNILLWLTKMSNLSYIKTKKFIIMLCMNLTLLNIALFLLYDRELWQCTCRLCSY